MFSLKNNYNNNDDDDKATTRLPMEHFLKTKVAVLSWPLGTHASQGGQLYESILTDREFIIKEKYIGFNVREMKR